MPSTETHIRVGKHLGGWGGGGAAAYHFLGPGTMPLLEGLSGAELPLYALTVWAAARLGSHLPDLIEPPDDPDHRGPFHSVTAYLLTLGKVACLWVGFAPLPTGLLPTGPLPTGPLPTGPLPTGVLPTGALWTYGRVFLVFFGMSYVAHLHLDAHTPDSIPWLSR